jgi:hypothetical protein
MIPCMIRNATDRNLEVIVFFAPSHPDLTQLRLPRRLSLAPSFPFARGARSGRSKRDGELATVTWKDGTACHCSCRPRARERAPMVPAILVRVLLHSRPLQVTVFMASQQRRDSFNPAPRKSGGLCNVRDHVQHILDRLASTQSRCFIPPLYSQRHVRPSIHAAHGRPTATGRALLFPA